MEILEDSDHRLKLKVEPDIGLKIIVFSFGIMLVGLPISMLPEMVEHLGVMTLKCLRFQPNRVACQKQRSAVLGLIRYPPEVYADVLAARHRTGTEPSSSGTIQTHWLSLNRQNDDAVTILEGDVVINGVKGDPEEMAALATQINQFITSNQPQLVLKRDNRFNALAFMIYAPISIFFIIGLGILSYLVHREDLIFDRQLGLLKRRRRTIVGFREEKLPLGEIEGVEVKTYRSARRTTHYLELLLTGLKSKTLLRTTWRSDASTAKQKIEQFLQASWPEQQHEMNNDSSRG